MIEINKNFSDFLKNGLNLAKIFQKIVNLCANFIGIFENFFEKTLLSKLPPSTGRGPPIINYNYGSTPLHSKR